MRLVVKLKVNVVPSLVLYDALVWVLHEQGARASIVDLGLHSKIVLYAWQVLKEYLVKIHSSGLLDLSLQSFVEIVHIPNLRWLCHSSSMRKSLPTVVGDRVLCTISETTEEKIAANESTCSTFSCIAMNNYYIILILLQKVVHLLAHFKQQM